MSSTSTRGLLFRFLGFALAPWAVVYLAEFAFWPSVYFTMPICFPFTAYTYDTALGRYTALHNDAFLYILMASYSIVVGLLATYFSRNRGVARATLGFLLATGAGALVVHGVAHVVGGIFWYDTP
jgi:hypothetical protein